MRSVLRSAGRIVGTVLVVVVLAYAFREPLLRTLFGPRDPAGLVRGATAGELPDDAVETVLAELEVPWEMAWGPDGSLWITERAGRLLRLPPEAWRGEVDPSGAASLRDAVTIPGVTHSGEGGLMGLALDPAFEENGRIYLALTYAGSGGTANRVDRYRVVEEADGFRLADRTPIIEEIPGASFHDGGRLRFGPEGRLWLTTGDAGRSDRAQETGSLAGKILRMEPDGGAPPDNPFGSLVFSYGHRNPQGLAWAANGTLWSTEHGPSGFASGRDEVNRIEAGVNYGWPEITGGESRPGMREPILHSGADYTWAPAGAAWSGESLFFGGLRGEALYEVRDAARNPTLVAHFQGEFGRIRPVRVGPDGLLYFATSNRDGRGRVRRGDDRLLRIDPRALRSRPPR